MSETDEHRDLVERMAKKLNALDKDLRVAVDLPGEVDYHRPPKISGFVPDVYASSRVTGAKYICEAKVLRRSENGLSLDPRSLEQIGAFIECINQSSLGLFVFGVYGNSSACFAKSLLRSFLKEKKISAEKVQIFDGCDYWHPEQKEGVVIWHLC